MGLLVRVGTETLLYQSSIVIIMLCNRTTKPSVHTAKSIYCLYVWAQLGALLIGAGPDHVSGNWLLCELRWPPRGQTGQFGSAPSIPHSPAGQPGCVSCWWQHCQSKKAQARRLLRPWLGTDTPTLFYWPNSNRRVGGIHSAFVRTPCHVTKGIFSGRAEEFGHFFKLHICY